MRVLALVLVHEYSRACSKTLYERGLRVRGVRRSYIPCAPQACRPRRPMRTGQLGRDDPPLDLCRRSPRRRFGKRQGSSLAGQPSPLPLYSGECERWTSTSSTSTPYAYPAHLPPTTGLGGILGADRRLHLATGAAAGAGRRLTALHCTGIKPQTVVL